MVPPGLQYLHRPSRNSTEGAIDEDLLGASTHPLGLQGRFPNQFVRPAWRNAPWIQPATGSPSSSKTNVRSEGFASTEDYVTEETANRAARYLPPSEEEGPASPTVVLGSWDGIVTAIEDESFTARVLPLVGEGPEEVAEFPLKDVSPSDLSLLHPGALFYWTIGYEKNHVGRVHRVSVIHNGFS